MDSVFSSRLARIETFLENALASDAAWKLVSFGALSNDVRDTHIACKPAERGELPRRIRCERVFEKGFDPCKA